ncbi:MAG: peptide chain release factor N(5)-glutamine methyltransferase [Terracidiphilus sp.]|jgi:release factor glutamine methyltransferase
MKSTVLSSQKIRALVADGEHALASGPHPDRARRDAESLFLHLLKRNGTERNTAWLLAHWNNPTSHGDEFRALIQRRLAGEPIQYITGEVEFYALPFRVTPDVLIPRPETEHLVEKVIELATTLRGSVSGHDFSRAESPTKQDWALAPGGTPSRFPRILDIGTGSGAIAISLAHHLPQAAITAIDLSAAALTIAHKNATRNAATDRIRFLHGDLLTPVANEQFDFVVSNPPYIPTADHDSLAVEVRDHEPVLALFAGPDGLDIYRRLIPQAFTCLVPGGLIVLEIGYGQSQVITDLLHASGFQSIEFVSDLQSIPRVAVAQHP